MKREEIDNMFNYHPPVGNQPEKYAEINRKALEFAHAINDICPGSAEATIAIRKVQEARMQANAAIALHDDGQTPMPRMSSGVQANALMNLIDRFTDTGMANEEFVQKAREILK